jgi:dihydroflavonol-4-reductase
VAKRDDTQEKTTALVTGATGFTGGHLARALVRRGSRVRALVRPQTDGSDLVRDGIEVVTGDVTDGDAVARAAEGVDVVYHIAALYRTAGHPDSYYHDVNVGGTRNVLDAAVRHDVARVVHCSTIGVHGAISEVPSDENSPYNPGDIYQRTKLEADLLAQEAFRNGIPGVVARPTGIYGPGDLRFLKLFRTIRSGRFRMFGSGEVPYHLTYIDDLVDGFILCGEKPEALGEVYILGGDEYASLNELVRLVAEAVGVKPPRGHLPLWPLMTAATLCERICRPLGIDPPLHKRRVEFFIKPRAFTNAKARRELGFRPRVPLAEGVRRTAAWYVEQGHLEPPPVR